MITSVICLRSAFLASAFVALTLSAFARNHHRSDDRLVNLRGNWHFSIGDDARRAQPGFDDSDWSTVHVPNYWEEEGYEEYNGYAWYRRTFSFGGDANQATYLLLGQIDDVDEVFLNGQRIGGTGRFPPHYATAYNQDRIYNLPAGLLRNGADNVIAVRVYDGAQGGGIGINSDAIGIYGSHAPLPEVQLGGEWKFHPGDNPAWKDEHADDSSFQAISVPSYWEQDGYDIDGFGWYRKSFRGPASTHDDTLVLMLGKIDDTDEVYLNGVKIGSTGKLDQSDRHSRGDYYAQLRGYYFPASLLKADNVLAVRVHDHGGRGGIYEGPLGIIGQSRYIDYWENIRRDRDWHHHGLSLLRALLDDDD
jgi:sialate O-acetylesterase